MVFIGESGSGKSTCINYFANYFTHSSFDEANHYSNMKIVIPNSICPQINYGSTSNQHTERNVHDNTVSQTQDCTEYGFTWNGKHVKIVDTLGFNDTYSTKDDENIQKILKKVSKFQLATAISITINGTNTRLSTSIKTTLTQLRGSLPDSVFQNLFFIFPNCTEETQNFNLRLIAEFNPSQQRTFNMQNSLFSIKDKSILQNSKLVKKMLQTWKDSVDTMADIMNEISQTSAASAQVFEDMRIKRERLIGHKENLIKKQKSLLNAIKTLDIEKDRLKNATNDQQANRNFAKQTAIPYIELEKKNRITVQFVHTMIQCEFVAKIVDCRMNQA
ncbi:unnamed protein product [Rotaria socialis]|uniref:G domain-containing protein n=1 Tax=Rotaria socialis TaxID=392032 RepID=A0A817P4R0_9BILA|nr:unnamed protein product [Rotaria socialis]CAF3241637.1 unnamed protein product [Rotaria socialis]CAF4120649.1 unnamed protein product [Rotaria socialis]CAF4203071.1 unnamed protein product [Rotaria socialis]